MSLTEKDVAKIAKLSRIRLTDDETTQMADQMNAIFGWIEQLQEVDVEGVEPMAGVGNQTLRLRTDVVNDGNVQDKVLKNATDAQFGCYTVPKMVE